MCWGEHRGLTDWAWKGPLPSIHHLSQLALGCPMTVQLCSNLTCVSLHSQFWWTPAIFRTRFRPSKCKDFYVPDIQVMKYLLVEQTKCTGFPFCDEAVWGGTVLWYIRGCSFVKPSNSVGLRLENIFHLTFGFFFLRIILKQRTEIWSSHSFPDLDCLTVSTGVVAMAAASSTVPRCVGVHG